MFHERLPAESSNLDSLSELTYQHACSELISETSGKTFGVGPKVADCVCLFSLGMLEAFPIDVWMIRCLMSQYPNLDRSFIKTDSGTADS